MSRRVLVIGGGISGLTTAYFLVRDSREKAEDVDVRVVESSRRAGGTLGSEEVDGFVFERGPNGFLDGVPETIDLSRELGLEGDLLESSSQAKRRYLLKGGELRPLPSKPGEFLKTPLLSLKGRLRVLAECFQPRARSGHEDSVASFGRRRLGVEATEILLDPLVTGIYGGDVERVSFPSAFPRLAELERKHGSLTKAIWRRVRQRRRARRNRDGTSGQGDKAAGPLGMGGKLRSFRGGLETLGRALSEHLGERLSLKTTVDAVAAAGDSLEVTYRGGDKEVFDSVVVAVPAPRAAALFGSSHPDLCQALDTVPYASVAVLCLGYLRQDIEHALDGYGFLVPRNQGLRTLGMIWTSSIFPEHAPAGRVSLRVLVGGARDPEVVAKSAEDLLQLVVGEVGEVLGIRAEPVVQRVYRYTQGIPQYNVGHAARVQAIEKQRWRVPALYLTGNAYRGVGLNDCVRESQRISDDVLRRLCP